MNMVKLVLISDRGTNDVVSLINYETKQNYVKEFIERNRLTVNKEEDRGCFFLHESYLDESFYTTSFETYKNIKNLLKKEQVLEYRLFEIYVKHDKQASATKEIREHIRWLETKARLTPELGIFAHPLLAHTYLDGRFGTGWSFDHDAARAAQFKACRESNFK